MTNNKQPSKSSLLEFIDSTEVDSEIWFLVPAGLICGKFFYYTETDGAILLNDVYMYIGNKSVEVDTAMILVSQISTWGDGIPVFIDDDDEE